jgi:hypothetical protein
MANRFALEREEGFVLAHFGLVNRKGLLLDRLTCIFPEYILRSQKENLVQYSDKIGLPKKDLPRWKPPALEESNISTLPVIDYIHVSQWDNAHAEICFWSFSQGHIADLIKMGKNAEVMPWGVALLRCEIDLQRAFLAQLYESDAG